MYIEHRLHHIYSIMKILPVRRFTSNECVVLCWLLSHSAQFHIGNFVRNELCVANAQIKIEFIDSEQWLMDS